MRAPRARRANLATIVGSGLAAVAAGSLIAFSSLAEQAGLEGLATGGLQPAHPGRTGGGGGRAITIPAPATAPPSDPRAELVELVRTTGERGRTPELVVRVADLPEPRLPARTGPSAPDARRRAQPAETQRRVAAATDPPEAETDHWGGPPYGRAHGYHGKKPKSPRSPKRHRAEPRSGDAPVYARSAHEAEAKPAKAPKMKKVEKKAGSTPPGHAKAKGHGKRGKSAGHSEHAPGRGKARGHSKHAHGRGKGKGHSKHGG
ncbi:MAG TPA: hypothetical protein VHN37_14970 [Actinomycetota bacterium]|nr:hypothetical protein [Actinomycetota bacterium]